MNGVDKYLQRYAEPVAAEAQALIKSYLRDQYKCCLVIPVFDETIGFIERLQQHAHSADLLVIAIVNRPLLPSDDHDFAYQEAVTRTRMLWTTLKSTGTPVAANELMCLNSLPSVSGRFDLLSLDLCTGERGLHHKQGVGLARKTGCDIALQVIHQGQAGSGWIYSTDADAYLPDNYFCARAPLTDTAAYHCAFEHFNPAGLSRAQQLYDLYLHYYVAGLKHANSPYAHYSLGSALVINSTHYAAVRGFPKRAAGEDFYLLNKLAKVGRVIHDPDVVVRLEERQSKRVPYGTGPAIAQISRLSNPDIDYRYFHPDCFHALRTWLSTMAQLPDNPPPPTDRPIEHWLLARWRKRPYGQTLLDALQAVGAINHLKLTLAKRSGQQQSSHQLMLGFDALKTLRLIHQLRDHAFGTCNAAQAREAMQRFTS